AETSSGNAASSSSDNTAKATSSVATKENSPASSMANPKSDESEAAPSTDNAMVASSEMKPSPEEEARARKREDRLYANLEVQQLLDLPPAERYKKILSMPVDTQLAFANSLRGGNGQEFLDGMDPKQKETLLAMNNPQNLVQDELVQAKLL